MCLKLRHLKKSTLIDLHLFTVIFLYLHLYTQKRSFDPLINLICKLFYIVHVKLSLQLKHAFKLKLWKKMLKFILTELRYLLFLSIPLFFFRWWNLLQMPQTQLFYGDFYLRWQSIRLAPCTIISTQWQ